MISKTLAIVNKLGLHARASSKLVELANRFDSEITIAKNNRRANAKSLMAVMMLAANKGSEVIITANGLDEKQAINEISDLINNKFNEAD